MYVASQLLSYPRFESADFVGTAVPAREHRSHRLLLSIVILSALHLNFRVCCNFYCPFLLNLLYPTDLARRCSFWVDVGLSRNIWGWFLILNHRVLQQVVYLNLLLSGKLKLKVIVWIVEIRVLRLIILHYNRLDSLRGPFRRIRQVPSTAAALVQVSQVLVFSIIARPF